ncbi:DUF2312 domain-containing protein [Devosia ginsengisoli]|uniref:DUF2312 domain-containing protein n=1 Tax=Devosia ginsengisoli TaxID=400770 RepID=A0A5B8LQR4_9HYPH|nr:GapR family DNA-binding domain-containing protein [Devosia ginsengisoli]QDZ10547.1 DUF2312 domain-containing protein [Devosia ginsengisoli]
MSESNVAQDQIKAYVDRILRMKDEADAVAADIREIYAEAKANGFDKTQLGNVVTYLRKRDKDADKMSEGEAIFDLYLDAYLGAAARPSRTHTREPAQAHTREDASTDSEPALDAWAEKVADHIDPALLLTIIEGSKTEAGRKIIMGAIEQVKAGDRVAALRADPAMAIVEPANLKKSIPPPPQPAGSDLADPAPAGQVAINPVAKAADDANSGSAMSEVSAAADAPEQAEVASRVAGDRAPAATSEDMDETAGETATNSTDDRSSDAPKEETDKPVEPSGSAAPAALYAEPGVVTWENCPPEGVKRHDYSYAFGDLGQDIAVIEDDLANAAAEPIVKIGCEILDGWARYTKARSMVGIDGQGIEYPVVQYDGADPLMDCIRWNLAGRIMNDAQRRLVAQRLAKLQPKRKSEIYAAFELGMELVA